MTLPSWTGGRATEFIDLDTALAALQSTLLQRISIQEVRVGLLKAELLKTTEQHERKQQIIHADLLLAEDRIGRLEQQTIPAYWRRFCRWVWPWR